MWDYQQHYGDFNEIMMISVANAINVTLEKGCLSFPLHYRFNQ